MSDRHDPPADADETEVPDADRDEDRHDFPDPAFDDDVDTTIETPLDGEGDGPELPDEDPALLDADEHIDPDEHDDPIPPEVGNES